MSIKYNRDIADSIDDKLDKNDPANLLGNFIPSFLALPGLIGAWSMSNFQRSTGNVYDLSVQSRTLTYNGNPTFGYENFVPYLHLAGS